MRVLWWYLRGMPWPFVTAMAIGAISLFVVWALTKWSLSQEWIRFAPTKARDQLQAMQRALAESELERQALQAELARYRGMVEAAKARLSRPRDAELVARAR